MDPRLQAFLRQVEAELVSNSQQEQNSPNLGTTFSPPLYRKAAEGVDEAFFLLTSEADLRRAYSVEGDKATLVLFKDWDEGKVVYDGDLAKSEGGSMGQR